MNRFPPELLASYPALRHVKSTPAQASGGYSGAGVWMVTAEENRFALRRWPRSGLSKDRILGLHRLLRHIAATHANLVSVPVPAKDGSTLLPIDGSLWQLEPWLPGVASFWTQPSDQKLTNAMQALAHWHAAANRFEAKSHEAQWFGSRRMETSPAIQERLRIVDRWLPDELAEVRQLVIRNSEFDRLAVRLCSMCQIALPTIRDELTSALNIKVNLQPCLRDVWHDHVLFENDAVTGIIDPSACRTETIATDIARLLGSLAEDDEGMWQAGLAAYDSYHPLSDDTFRLVRILDRSTVVLSPLTWLRRRYILKTSFDEEAVLTRLQRLTKRLMAFRQ
ncbi:MAG: phosphotransferase enzyme family protein [Planctomycetaceae bacterium]